MALAAPLLAAALLAGCQSTGTAPTTTRASASDEVRDLADGLADAIGRCWFDKSETGFSGYLYTPENIGGWPRILVVAKNDPTGRPSLVVEPREGGQVVVYGPLMDGQLGPQISADIDRWRTGGTACSS